MKIEPQRLVFDESPITSGQYNTLRIAVGWHPFSEERCMQALKNSVFTLKVYVDSRLAGMGRIVGDGAIYLYIHDVIIIPQFQRQGIGSMIMERLMSKVHDLAPSNSGAFIGLMISPGLQDFYRNFGFEEYPGNSPGMCIWKTNIKKRLEL